MKSLLLSLVALFSLTAFAQTAFAQAQPATVVSDQPVAFEIANPCNGDGVSVSGTLHTVAHSTVTATGGFLFRAVVSTVLARERQRDPGHLRGNYPHAEQQRG